MTGRCEVDQLSQVENIALQFWLVLQISDEAKAFSPSGPGSLAETAQDYKASSRAVSVLRGLAAVLCRH